MNRVLVIGAGGAGKTTLARRLARCTNLPLVHLDTLYWRPGWEPTPREEWRSKVEALARSEQWIMDGNYESTLDIRLPACDTVVFVDRHRVLCVWRVFVRRIRHMGRRRPELPVGCQERLTWEFLSWIWTYASRRREGILSQLELLCASKRVVILRSGNSTEQFLRGICDAPAV